MIYPGRTISGKLALCFGEQFGTLIQNFQSILCLLKGIPVGKWTMWWDEIRQPAGE